MTLDTFSPPFDLRPLLPAHMTHNLLPGYFTPLRHIPLPGFRQRPALRPCRQPVVPDLSLCFFKDCFVHLEILGLFSVPASSTTIINLQPEILNSNIFSGGGVKSPIIQNSPQGLPARALVPPSFLRNECRLFSPLSGASGTSGTSDTSGASDTSETSTNLRLYTPHQ
jgi:hypothetical protein